MIARCRRQGFVRPPLSHLYRGMNQNLVYYGGLASGDWLILEIQGLDHWKPKSLLKERDGEKIYWSVTAPSACWTLQSTKLEDDRTPTRRGLLFTVVAERMLEKEKCSFYCVLCNKSMYVMRLQDSNGLRQLSATVLPLLSVCRPFLASRVFLKGTLCHVIRKNGNYK